AQFIDLLRGNQNKAGALNAVSHPLGRLGEQVVQLGLEHRNPGILPEKGDSILAIFNYFAVDLQSEFSTASSDDVRRPIRLRKTSRHADFGYGWNFGNRGLDFQLEIIGQ